jgi:hypothetical protein
LNDRIFWVLIFSMGQIGLNYELFWVNTNYIIQ